MQDLPELRPGDLLTFGPSSPEAMYDLEVQRQDLSAVGILLLRGTTLWGVWHEITKSVSLTWPSTPRTDPGQALLEAACTQRLRLEAKTPRVFT